MQDELHCDWIVVGGIMYFAIPSIIMHYAFYSALGHKAHGDFPGSLKALYDWNLGVKCGQTITVVRMVS